MQTFSNDILSTTGLSSIHHLFQAIQDLGNAGLNPSEHVKNQLLEESKSFFQLYSGNFDKNIFTELYFADWVRLSEVLEKRSVSDQLLAEALLFCNDMERLLTDAPLHAVVSNLDELVGVLTDLASWSDHFSDDGYLGMDLDGPTSQTTLQLMASS